MNRSDIHKVKYTNQNILSVKLVVQTVKARNTKKKNKLLWLWMFTSCLLKDKWNLNRQRKFPRSVYVEGH